MSPNQSATPSHSFLLCAVSPFAIAIFAAAMKAVNVTRLVADPSEVTVSEIPTPTPETCPPGSVIVRVLGIGLNYLEVLMLKGTYQHKPKLPFVPGIEWVYKKGDKWTRPS